MRVCVCVYVSAIDLVLERCIVSQLCKVVHKI